MDPIVSAILAVAALIVGYLVRPFVGSYSTEKGKNLAMQEDIAKITRLVEEVKANQSIMLQGQISFHEERKEALLAAWDALRNRIEPLAETKVNPLLEHSSETVHFWENCASINLLEYTRAYNRLKIYFYDDPDIEKGFQDVVMGIYHFQGQMHGFTGSIRNLWGFKNDAYPYMPPEKCDQDIRKALQALERQRTTQLKELLQLEDRLMKVIHEKLKDATS